MMEFNYKGALKIRRLYSQVIGVIGVLFFSLVAIFALSGIWIFPHTNQSVPIINDPRLSLFCFAFWALIISWAVGFLFIDYFPTIWLLDDGILISTLLIFRKKIYWEDILDISQGKLPNGSIIVRVKKITPLHRIFGWYYTRSLYPGFIIHKDIDDFDYLLNELRKRIGKRVIR